MPGRTRVVAATVRVDAVESETIKRSRSDTVFARGFTERTYALL